MGGPNQWVKVKITSQFRKKMAEWLRLIHPNREPEKGDGNRIRVIPPPHDNDWS